jgi:hypothetical protein
VITVDEDNSNPDRRCRRHVEIATEEHSDGNDLKCPVLDPTIPSTTPGRQEITARAIDEIVEDLPLNAKGDRCNFGRVHILYLIISIIYVQ